MKLARSKASWGRRLSWLALLLSLGGIALSLGAAIGTGAGAWTYRAGLGALRYALFAATGGAVLAILAFLVGRKNAARTGRPNAVALIASGLFLLYLGSQIVTARSVPAIHDASTNLDDLPNFRRLAVRADNLENIPDEGRNELAAMRPEDRWKALHRRAYPELRTLRLPQAPNDVLRKGEQLARDRGWEVASVDFGSGTIEATATSLFFRFKDDVVVRVRPDPARRGGALVDMRSISRVGGSDIGVNAKRIRSFLDDLAKTAA